MKFGQNGVRVTRFQHPQKIFTLKTVPLIALLQSLLNILRFPTYFDPIPLLISQPLHCIFEPEAHRPLTPGASYLLMGYQTLQLLKMIPAKPTIERDPRMVVLKMVHESIEVSVPSWANST